jgi:TolB-like protein/Tfp pilus assembly protein PilF
MTDRLDSWKEIATYLKRSVRTVHRWEAEQGLPVHRHLHQSSGTVYAFKHELDHWWASRRVELEAPTAGTQDTRNSEGRPAARARRGWIMVSAGVATVALFVAWLLFRGVDTAPSPSSIRSVAVLPLENLTGDPAHEYFADALTDALITQLAQSGDLRVISRTSVVQYKRTKKPLPAIAKELDVEGVIEGTVLRSGSRVRITAQLIDIRTDRHLWAKSYERDVSDVMGLQEEIAAAIGGAVAGPLADGRRSTPSSSRRVNAEAAELLYKGIAAAAPPTAQAMADAIRYFEEAIQKQPDFAEAYAAMARCYDQLLFVSARPPGDFMPKAEAAARKAIELNDHLAEAHAALGFGLFRYRWQWAAAEQEFRRALALNPNYAYAHQVFSGFLAAMGRREEAMQEGTRARQLDPLSMQGALDLAASYRSSRQYDRAIAEFRTILQKETAPPRAHFQLGMTYVEAGRPDEAMPELAAAVKLSNSPNTRFLAYLGYAQAASGRRVEARRTLDTLNAMAADQYISPLGVAAIHAGLGEKPSALAWLQKAYEANDGDLALLGTDNRFDTLRAEPAFQEVWRRVGPGDARR